MTAMRGGKIPCIYSIRTIYCISPAAGNSLALPVDRNALSRLVMDCPFPPNPLFYRLDSRRLELYRKPL